MKIKPLEDRVLVKPSEAKEKTSAGIFLPESAKEKPMHGKVVAVGPGKVNEEGERNAPQVKKGDLVVYGKYAGTEVEVDGDDHVILRESELLAVLDK
jgi:chaperonin GroES